MDDMNPREMVQSVGMIGGPLSNEPIFSPAEIRHMPKGMRILFDPQMRAFFEEMARQMADPKNQMTPKHLKGDVQLCFAIIRRSLNWSMDPYEVAACTYNVKGSLGYYGKLVRGIILGSGKVAQLKFEHGPSLEAWEKVEGKFKLLNSKRTDENGEPIKYMAPNYPAEAEDGLWARAFALNHDGEIIGETGKRLLKSCHPRNSTVWAYSPKKQICEVLSREIGDSVCADIMFGANFDVGLGAPDTPEAAVLRPDPDKAPPMQDITPEKELEAEGEPQEEPEEEKTKRAPRIKIEFRGEEYTKTNFTRDIKYLIRTAETVNLLVQLHTETVAALQGKSDVHDKLLEEINPLFTKRRDELMPPEEEAEEPEEERDPPLAGIQDDLDDETEIDLV